MEAKELRQVFDVGVKYSIYRISEAMAMTGKTEIVVKEINDNQIIFTKARGRKRFIIRYESRSYQSAPMKPFRAAIFEGWDQPIKCDSETNGIMRGNACYNFEGSVEDIRAWIEAGQLNPFFEKYKVLAVVNLNNASEELVYPELYNGGHAVLDGILRAQTA